MIEFDAEITDEVASREWHRSQQIDVNEDGSIVIRLFVSIDGALRTWILGFGGMARVVSPTSLAREILDEIQRARDRYIPKLKFEPLKMGTSEGVYARHDVRTQSAQRRSG